MTSLTRYSSWFYSFLTGAHVRRHDIREDSIGAAAHFRIVIIASLAEFLFGFDTAVIAGVTTALREFFSLSPADLGAAFSLRGGAHCSEQRRRRPRRSPWQPQHSASRRSALRDLRTRLRSCVELHVFRVVSTPRRNRRRRIFGARTHISRGNRAVASANMVPLQFIAAFFSILGTHGALLKRMNERLCAAEQKVSRRNM